MQRYRQLRLVIQLGTKQTSYHMVLRTVKGKDEFDRRLSSGQFPQRLDPDVPRDVLDTLERCLHDLRRRHGILDPAQRSGAPGGDGGRPTADQVDTLPLYTISRDGRTLDYDGREI